MPSLRTAVVAIGLGALAIGAMTAPGIARSSTKVGAEKSATPTVVAESRSFGWFSTVGRSGSSIYCRYYPCPFYPPGTMMPNAYRGYYDGSWRYWRDW